MIGDRSTPKVDFDIALFGATLGLVLIGILFIFSSGMTVDGVLVSNEFVKQIIWATLGAGILILFSLIDYARFRDYSLYIYLFFILVLVYTRFFGRVVNGARSWIGIGEASIQPSEFMKIATILYLARYLDDSRRSVKPLTRFFVAMAIAFLPMALILLQPDFGTSLVFIPILLSMCLVGGVDLSHILYLIMTGSVTVLLVVLPLARKFSGGKTADMVMLTDPRYALGLIAVSAVVLALAVAGYLIFKKRYYYWIAYASSSAFLGVGASLIGKKVLKEYQMMRLIVFLDPYIDPSGSGWNIIQSMTAIGSGGFFGKGFLKGTQSHYRFLPQQSTDFIFSIISEEIGFLGCLAVFVLFLVVIWRCFYVARNAQDRVGGLLATGVLSMIFFHFMINVGMAMGIMPITGIPLFFLSYGGSSLWAALMGIGLVLSVYARRFRH
jgi:rod shape determining protein RodA